MSLDSLSNNNDSIENVVKAIDLTSETTRHVCHVFWYIFWPSLRDHHIVFLNVNMVLKNSTLRTEIHKHFTNRPF